MKRMLLWLVAMTLLCSCMAPLAPPTPAAVPPPPDPAALTARLIREGSSPALEEELRVCAAQYRALQESFSSSPNAVDAAEQSAALLDALAEGSLSFSKGSALVQKVVSARLTARAASAWGDYFLAFDPECDPMLALAALEMERRYADDRAAGRIVLTAAGDTTFGEYPEVPPAISFNSEFVRRGEDPAFPLALVSPFFRADDLTILNCEGTFTHSDDPLQKTYRFKGPPHYADMFALGDVEAVNLANNHAYDYRQQGYDDTRTALVDAGVDFWGDRELYLTQVQGVTVGCVGYNLFNIEPELDEILADDIASLREDGAQLVVTNFHWGMEYAPYANDYQQRTAHQAVDAGADLVIGHHPHVLQGIERYRGVSILYSLGNFAFGGDEELKDRDTVLVRQSFELIEGRAVSGELLLQPAYLSTSDHYNNYSPPPVFGDEAERIADKIVQRSAHLADGVTREDFALLS